MKNYKFDRLFDREIKKDKKKYRMKVGFLKAATLLGSISAVSFVNFAIAWSNYNKTFGKRIAHAMSTPANMPAMAKILNNAVGEIISSIKPPTYEIHELQDAKNTQKSQKKVPM